MIDLWQEPFTLGDPSDAPGDPTTDVARGAQRPYPPPLLALGWEDALAGGPPASSEVAELRQQLDALRREVGRLQGALGATAPLAARPARPRLVAARGSNVVAEGKVVAVTRRGVRLALTEVTVDFATSAASPAVVVGQDVSVPLAAVPARAEPDEDDLWAAEGLPSDLGVGEE